MAGISYTTQSIFFQKKAAEQEASRLALEIILGKTRDEGLLMYKIVCKSFRQGQTLQFLYIKLLMRDNHMIQSLGQLSGWLGLVTLLDPHFPRKKLLKWKHLDLLMELSFIRPQMNNLWCTKIVCMTARSYFAIPVYQTVNEGKPHDLKFRSIVWWLKLVTLPNPHFHRKKVVE